LTDALELSVELVNVESKLSEHVLVPAAEWLPPFGELQKCSVVPV
jgi:hypothetical protein